jgi:hypothetical protein
MCCTVSTKAKPRQESTDKAQKTKKKKTPVVSLGIFSEATDGTMCPGVDSASKNEYQETPGGKGGRTGVTTLPPS